MIKDITDLQVYNEAMSLLPLIYKLTSKLPGSESGLSSQIRRAAQSIIANLAEGFAKRFSDKEFRRFMMISLGSSDEVIAHLRMLCIICPDFANESNPLIEKYKILSKRINTLHKN